MSKKESRNTAGAGVLDHVNGWNELDSKYFAELLSGQQYRDMTVDEVRELLNARLGNKSLSDYIRQDRDE